MNKRARKHLEMALGGNMNIATLKPLALIEIMTDFAKKEVEAINYTHSCTELICDNCDGAGGKNFTKGFLQCPKCKGSGKN